MAKKFSQKVELFAKKLRRNMNGFLRIDFFQFSPVNFWYHWTSGKE
jgi:hypothetical protein